MAAKRQAPTMKDVAKVAGVSVQTVSAVVNDKPEISQKTRERVLAAIKHLGYRPYAVARSLRTRSTRTIALVVSDVTNPFFATMASTAEDYAHNSGYNLVLYNTHSDTERETNYIHTATQRWIDGLLFVPTRDQVNGLESLRKAGIAMVAIDRIPDHYDGPSVTLDNLKTGRLVAEHLLELGHTNIAHISGPMDLRLSRERLQGLQEVMTERGLEPGPHVAGDDNWSCESGYQAMQCLLETRPRPTAVYAANDRLAIGAMRAINEAGLQIPQDISMVGVDDIELSAFQTPPLTTVRQSLIGVTTLGIKILLEILKGQEPEQSKVVLDPTLVVRDSTAKPGLKS